MTIQSVMQCDKTQLDKNSKPYTTGKTERDGLILLRSRKRELGGK